MERSIHTIAEHDSLRNYQLLMSLVVPRPIAWVSTYNEDGSVNLAPYALFAVVSTEPPIVQFASRRPKDSSRNAAERGAFVVNFANTEQQKLVALTSQEMPYGESEADAAGLECFKAPNVDAPMVEGCRAALECRTLEAVTVGGSLVTYGLVETIHIDPAIVAEDGMADFAALDPLSKLGRNEWGSTTAFKPQP
ncbi:MAG: flavin reductase family protein [Actinomycetaceae bacterium]|nr:flavin reductase family protein [Actinomycetaceae bacterium]